MKASSTPTSTTPAGTAEHRCAAVPDLGVALVVVTDQRTSGTDGTTPLVRELCDAARYRLVRHDRVPNQDGEILAALEALVGDETADVILFSGGTGLSPRDRTVDSIAPRFERTIDGFGELFRALTFAEIGTPALLSRATAGIIAGRPVFLLPGSPHAVRLAVERLILPELGHLVAHVRRRV